MIARTASVTVPVGSSRSQVRQRHAPPDRHSESDWHWHRGASASCTVLRGSDRRNAIRCSEVIFV